MSSSSQPARRSPSGPQTYPSGDTAPKRLTILGRLMSTASSCPMTRLTPFIDPQNGSKSRRRGIQVREHTNLSGLERVCQDPPRPSPNVVRVFHVQNAPWATNFLIKKFGIDQTSEIVGNDFAPWARARRAERRGGRPYPRAHSWDVKHDTWRSIAKTSFAIDYLATQQVDGVNPLCEQGEAEKVMELSHYAEHSKSCRRLMV